MCNFFGIGDLRVILLFCRYDRTYPIPYKVKTSLFVQRFLLRNVPMQGQKSVLGKRDEMIFATNEELFGVIQLQENGTPQPDDAAGRLLIRNVQTAWLKLADSSSQTVYEAIVEKVDTTSIVLKLSSQICIDLHLTNTGKISVDVQFQLNRQPLCEWHDAIDRLGPIHRSLLFPEANPSQMTHEVGVTLLNYSLLTCTVIVPCMCYMENRYNYTINTPILVP